jgi:hypothetical protein
MTTFTIPMLLATAIVLSMSVPCGVAHAETQQQGLATQTGRTVGVSVADHQYDEPGVMRLRSHKVGIDFSGTYALVSQWPHATQGWFLRGDLQYAGGKADYSSPFSGNLNDTADWFYELRGYLGKDIALGAYLLAPQIGWGYRYSYNDLRGGTTAGNSGYRRENTMQTLSIGLLHRMKLKHGAQLTSTIEYMRLVKGVHSAKLSDAGLGFSDVQMSQNSGNGFRLNTIWRLDRWSFGPTLTYWNIKDSETANSGGRSWKEPRNKTTELGFKGNYHF